MKFIFIFGVPFTIKLHCICLELNRGYRGNGLRCLGCGLSAKHPCPFKQENSRPDHRLATFLKNSNLLDR